MIKKTKQKIKKKEVKIEKVVEIIPKKADWVKREIKKCEDLLANPQVRDVQKLYIQKYLKSII
jgi:phosphoribosylformylglycinamidine (FGAM) synthase PurS component